MMDDDNDNILKNYQDFFPFFR